MDSMQVRIGIGEIEQASKRIRSNKHPDLVETSQIVDLQRERFTAIFSQSTIDTLPINIRNYTIIGDGTNAHVKRG